MRISSVGGWQRHRIAIWSGHAAAVSHEFKDGFTLSRRVAIVRAESAQSSSARRVTARQSEILDRIASGLPDKEIARQLGISQRTVRTHLERLFSAHGLHDRAAAAVFWVRMNG